jgi:hypothetical protein
MSDKRSICRIELLETILNERERLVDDAAMVAAQGIAGEGVTADTGIEVLCMLRAVYEIDRLRDEVAAMTKHAPSGHATSGEHDRA